jgi:hypothetical protein
MEDVVALGLVFSEKYFHVHSTKTIEEAISGAL